MAVAERRRDTERLSQSLRRSRIVSGAYFARVKSMQWVFFSLDLIGAGVVVVALAYGIFVLWHIRKMEQLDD